MAYEKARIAVDPVILTISDGVLKALLRRREKEPFKGRHELLGGLIQREETAEAALRRKLKETLGEDAYFAQFRTFTAPDRDPRERTVSIASIALIGEHRLASKEGWFALDRLPSLAFDHAEIIRAAHAHLKQNLNSDIVRHFLPDRFPLNQLQAVHEAVTGERYDNRNFRRKMLAAGSVEETRERERDVSHRPATLYRFRR